MKPEHVISVLIVGMALTCLYIYATYNSVSGVDNLFPWILIGASNVLLASFIGSLMTGNSIQAQDAAVSLGRVTSGTRLSGSLILLIVFVATSLASATAVWTITSPPGSEKDSTAENLADKPDEEAAKNTAGTSDEVPITTEPNTKLTMEEE